MFHHKKNCKGKRQKTECAQTTASLHETDDLSNQGQLHELEPNHEPVAAVTLPVAEPAVLQLKRLSLTLKTKEILTFLGTAEKGEGCSREHAQCRLNYQHAKGGPNAKLLPKDIRTCWSHVAKVLYVLM
jgi:hypothetical protein